MPITFAVIKERKSPPDRRVVLTPTACKTLLNNHPEAEVIVESSDIRAFSDAEYQAQGLEIRGHQKTSYHLANIRLKIFLKSGQI